MMVGDWQIFIINNIIGRWEEEEEIKLKGVCERKWGKWYDDEQFKGMVKGIVGCNYGCFLQSGGDDWGIFCFYCLIVHKWIERKEKRKRKSVRILGCSW